MTREELDVGLPLPEWASARFRAYEVHESAIAGVPRFVPIDAGDHRSLPASQFDEVVAAVLAVRDVERAPDAAASEPPIDPNALVGFLLEIDRLLDSLDER